MLKKISAFILTAVMLLSGCNSSAGTDSTTASPVVPAEAWEYEYYIEELDYHMGKYDAAVAEFSELVALQDWSAAKKEAESHIELLDNISEIIIPVGLEECEEDILTAVEYEKEYRRMAVQLFDYYINGSEQAQIDALALELDELGKENISINSAVNAAKEKAFSYLPNGEYRAYVMNLETLWNKYVTESDKLYDVFFNGVKGNALVLSEKCLEILSEIENMEVPEQVKPYHDDILKAIPAEREYSLAVKTIKELNNEYQGLAFEDTPADVQEQVKKCSEIIDNYLSEENEDFDALYDAVVAAGEFAEAQAK